MPRPASAPRRHRPAMRRPAPAPRCRPHHPVRRCAARPRPGSGGSAAAACAHGRGWQAPVPRRRIRHAARSGCRPHARAAPARRIIRCRRPLRRSHRTMIRSQELSRQLGMGRCSYFRSFCAAQIGRWQDAASPYRAGRIWPGRMLYSRRAGKFCRGLAGRRQVVIMRGSPGQPGNSVTRVRSHPPGAPGRKSHFWRTHAQR